MGSPLNPTYKTVVFNIAFFLLIVSAIEFFFVQNKKFSMLKPRPGEPTNAVSVATLPESLNLQLIEDWPYPSPSDPALTGKNKSDLDISQKYGNSPLVGARIQTFNSVGLLRLKNSNTVIYKTQYNYEMPGVLGKTYRASLFENAKAENFIINIGDSITFGEGVEQAYTISSLLNKKFQNYNNYNFGIPGTSPSDHLLLLEQGLDRRFENVKEEKGILIYHHFDFHMGRAIDSMANYLPNSSAAIARPLYELKDGRPLLKNRELIFERAKVFFYRLLASSETLAYFNINLPPNFDDQDYRLYLSLVKSLFQEYEKHFKILGRYVVLHPRTNDTQVRQFKKLAEEFKIKILDYSMFNPAAILENRDIIPLDQHPTAQYYQLMSELIANDLNHAL